MIYEYLVQTQSGSTFDNLERLGDRLQGTLNGTEAEANMENDWELFQINTLDDPQGIKGLILVYRRPK